ncbi:MAG: DNA gyrase C-terminal beta-propeller domain-containing protein, partial [Bacteroidales bacterium]|nr:DNA gyrase C-terminal beta-propeller domain-containing protein [Bacteroidales bacterium]
IVYEIKRDAMAHVVLNNLYLMTPLQSSFNVNNIALVHGRPMLLNLKQLISYYVEHRHEVLLRKTRFELDVAEKRSHILEGLLKALDIIDEIITVIRESRTSDIAKDALMTRFGFSLEQTSAILAMRLSSLTGLERDKLQAEYDTLQEKIKYYHEILSDYNLRMSILKQDLLDIKEQYGDERRTKIEYSSADLSMEDLITNEKVVVTITKMGYIKRTPLTEYRAQKRGGKGAKGLSSREEDYIEHIFVADTHNYMLFFTSAGKCYWLRIFEIPEGSKTSKGRAVQNIMAIPQEETIKAYINVDNIAPEYLSTHYIVLCSKLGVIKKTTMEAYSKPRKTGIIAINIRENDELLEACQTNGNSEILIATKKGRAIRFPENTVRPMGRTASGVKAVSLNDSEDYVVGMVCPENEDADILVVSEHGYGKKSKLGEYRITNRGGKGVKTMNVTDKTGMVIAIKGVCDSDDLIIINKSGLLIRLKVAELRVVGRATQGVKLINIAENDSIAAVTLVQHSDEDDEDVEEIEGENLEIETETETENETRITEE